MVGNNPNTLSSNYLYTILLRYYSIFVIRILHPIFLQDSIFAILLFRFVSLTDKILTLLSFLVRLFY